MAETKKTVAKKPEKICSNCRTKLTGESKRVVTKEGGIAELCFKCHEGIEKALHMESKDVNFPLALGLGLIAGIIGAFIWYGIVVLTQWQFGLIALVIGYLVGFGVMIGAGRRRSVSLQIMSGVIALGSILFGEVLITSHFVLQAMAEQGMKLGFFDLDLGKVIGLTFELLGEDPLTLLFWGIAVWVAFGIPKPAKLRTV
ncbi:MAG: hypothetical protein QF824_04525 [Candidatus Woesearchaeota archaeon]|jgi:uncharacterized membrane protein|nr:hypothetical protein [Candidatus Woesearchaeota archaeon]